MIMIAGLQAEARRRIGKDETRIKKLFKYTINLFTI